MDEIKTYKQRVEKNPDDAEAHFLLGVTYANLKMYKKSIESFKQVIRIDPYCADAHNNTGLVYFESGKYKESIESSKQAIRIDPDCMDAHYNLGVTYANLKMYKKSIESYKQAIRIDPDYRDAYYNLGHAYYELGKYKESIEPNKQAIRIDPDFVLAHHNLGAAYSELGKKEEAIESYKQAIRIDPDYATAHRGLGRAYSDSGKYNEAIESYKQAIRIDPDDAEAYNGLGHAYHKLGKFNESIESLKQAIKLDPDADEAGEIWYKGEDPEEDPEDEEDEELRKPKITTLRSSYKTLSVSQVQSMPNVSIRENDEWGFFGYSTINHDYNFKAVGGDVVVIANVTGLMWHQSGTDNRLARFEANEWVEDLNSKGGYAGYHDWRLPTVDEAVSLLESSKKNGDLYIDPVFSSKQPYIWTGDKCDYVFEDGSEAAWYVFFDISYDYKERKLALNFRSGYVGRGIGSDDSLWVRPVRSVR